MSKYQAEEQWLAQLQTGDDQHWKAFYEEVRQAFRLFFIKKTSLSMEEASELLHEAMVIFHRKVMSGGLQAPLESKLSTYLIGIGKILARKKEISKADQWDTEIPDPGVAPDVERYENSKANAVLVDRLLQKIGQPCRQLLELFYIKGYAIDAVMTTLDLPSEGATRKKKFDCLKKMRTLI